MSADTYGAAATILTHGLGLFGIRAEITLPMHRSASGRDADHYVDAYVGAFTAAPQTAFMECGIGFYGPEHNPTASGKSAPAAFAGSWSTLVNPLGGRLQGVPPQAGQRNERFAGGNTLTIELSIDRPNHAQFLVNGRPFRSSTGFTFGFGGKGVEAGTFKKGFNMKACIGLNDKGGQGLSFKDMRVTITSVLRNPDGRKWSAPPLFTSILDLKNAEQLQNGPELIVSYPRSATA